MSWLTTLAETDPPLHAQIFHDCLPLSSDSARCLGLYRGADTAGDWYWYTHNGALSQNGGRGMRSWIASFPFDLQAAVVINTRELQSDDPTEPPIIPIEHGDEILTKCFKAVLQPPPNPD